ncbi:restriction endonuclease [Ottowia pentelensis]|uniref:restriction endonuclease n=1 Tax=Ottowia pentelensis TaxID=511108 RepID=UPI00366A6F4E
MTLIAMGLGMLLVPTMLGSSVVASALGTGLRTPGWIMLGLGALAIALHMLFLKLNATKQVAKARPASSSRAKVEPSTTYGSPAMHPIRTIGEERVEPSFAPQPPATPFISATLAHERLTHWSPEVFAAIEWRRFEAVVEQLFAQAGFETRAQSHGADGGVDVWLHSRHAGGAPVGVVQCKHWQGKPVSVSAMREFFGVMASHDLKRGTYATTSRFTADALAFTRANGINGQDGDGLLALIAARTPEQQAALLATAFDGEYWRPTCPSCGVKMSDRASRKTGERFWGCVNYPRCKTALPMTKAAASGLPV